MVVSDLKSSLTQMRGASIIEVLLAMAIVAMATPFVYNRINETNHMIHDIAVARRIMSVRDSALNFVRMNQDRWPDTAQIRLADTELGAISADAASGFIDKYATSGATTTDVYLAFEVSDSRLRATQIARHIGSDAAIVSPDGVAYGDTWAVAAPDFVPGDLIYRISRDVVGEDTSKYLHRASSGADDLNVMQRDLNMAHHNVYNVASMIADSATIRRANVAFIDTDELTSNAIYFSSGANMDGRDINLGSVRVSGDVSGFKSITAQDINGGGYTTTGRVIADKVSITDSVNVARDLVLKSDASRTISDFTGISANAVIAPFISAEEMIFYDNFGLTVSGELLMSTMSPLKIGDWVFPSTRPPEFSKFTVSRADMPAMPSSSAFRKIMSSGWQGGASTSTPTITVP